MRQRLSWDEEKVAEISKKADPYTMNQERSNPPVEKYKTGDPSAWAEDQNKSTPWATEGRTETGHPAPAREAVVQARKLEDKALKCITIAQRMLPGAVDTIIEDQATELMFLPERAIMATLQRQSELATKIAAEKEEEVKEDEKEAAKKEEEKEEVEAAKKEEEKEEVEAAKKEEEKEEVEAAKKEEKEEEMKDEKEAAKKEEEEKEEVEAAKKDEEKEEEEVKEASDKDLLDILFDTAEIMPQEVKLGAKKLSGLVKKASGSDPLAGLWACPPDVSDAF